MDRNPHYFWAVRMPTAIKHRIYDQFNDLQQVFPFKRWVHKDDYHITLAFLGSVESSKLNVVVELVQEGMKEEKAFPLQVEGINIFGNKHSPRIFWASVNDEERLHRLQALVANQCIEAGLRLETRPFHPHITLARNWTGSDFNQQLLQKCNPFAGKPFSFEVNEVVLYQTNLEKTPKYESIATFSLVGE